MSKIKSVSLYGNQLTISFDDDTKSLAYNQAGSQLWNVGPNTGDVIYLKTNGVLISALYDNGDEDLGYAISDNLWILNGTHSTIPPLYDLWEWPLNTSIMTISSPYGPRTVPYTGFHAGIDITKNGITGTPVWCAADGTVQSRYYNADAGNAIAINHDDGSRTVYMHFIAPALVSSGRVVKGQVLGNVGATGDATGPHLHFETREGIDFHTINPIDFMANRGHWFGEGQGA